MKIIETESNELVITRCYIIALKPISAHNLHALNISQVLINEN